MFANVDEGSIRQKGRMGMRARMFGEADRQNEAFPAAPL